MLSSQQTQIRELGCLPSQGVAGSNHDALHQHHQQLLRLLLEAPQLQEVRGELRAALKRLDSGKATSIAQALGDFRFKLKELLPPGLGDQILRLGMATEEGILGQGLAELATAFQDHGESGVAQQLYSLSAQILENRKGYACIQQQAQHQAMVLGGGGDRGDQFKLLVGNVSHEMKNYGMLVGMMAAGVANPLGARWVGRLLGSSVRQGVKLAAANLGGLLADGLAFEAAHRGVDLLQNKSVQPFGESLKGAYWMIGSLRIAGVLGRTFSQSSRFTKAVRRFAPHYQRSIHQVVHNTFEYSGIYFSQTQGDLVGLEKSVAPYAWMQSLFTLGHFKMAGATLRALAPGFGPLSRSLQIETALILRQGASRVGARLQSLLQDNGRLPPSRLGPRALAAGTGARGSVSPALRDFESWETRERGEGTVSMMVGDVKAGTPFPKELAQVKDILDRLGPDTDHIYGLVKVIRQYIPGLAAPEGLPERDLQSAEVAALIGDLKRALSQVPRKWMSPLGDLLAYYGRNMHEIKDCFSAQKPIWLFHFLLDRKTACHNLDEGVYDTAQQSLGNQVTAMGVPQQTEFAKLMVDALPNPTTRRIRRRGFAAIRYFGRTFPYFHQKVQAGLPGMERLLELAEHPEEAVRWRVAAAFYPMVDSRSNYPSSDEGPKVDLRTSMKIISVLTERVRDPQAITREAALRILGRVELAIPRAIWIELSSQFIQVALTGSEEAHRDAAKKILFYGFGRLRSEGKIEFIRTALDNYSLNDLPDELLLQALEKIPTRSWQTAIPDTGHPQLELLARYSESGLPVEASYLRAYLASPTPQRYLEEMAQVLAAQRDGKVH